MSNPEVDPSPSTATPIGVPIYIDTQRRKRYTIPIRPAPTPENLSSFLVQLQQEQQQAQNENSSSSTSFSSYKNFTSTTSILVSGLPAFMSVPEMLHVLFYEQEHQNQRDEETTTMNHADNKEDQTLLMKGGHSHHNNNAGVHYSASATVPEIPNLFFRFLNNIRVCFGTEHGTISFLVTFFNDEDHRLTTSSSSSSSSTNANNNNDGNPENNNNNDKNQKNSTIMKFVYSNAAREFFNRWHGQSAFPQAKEIITVDFVDVDAMLKKEMMNTLPINDKPSNNLVTTDHGGYVPISDASSWWNFFQSTTTTSSSSTSAIVSPSKTHTPKKSCDASTNQLEPCPICLDEIGFSLSSSATSFLTNEKTSNESEKDEIDTTDEFYSQLFAFAPSLELPCRHILHASCFASVTGDAPCPLCRFNCCEEAFAACCSVCKRSASSFSDNTNHNNNNSNHNNSLWICLVCGDCFCTRNNREGNLNTSDNNNNNLDHRQNHFVSHPSHHLFVQSGGFRIWDATLDDFLHRILWNLNKQQQVENERKQKRIEEKDERKKQRRLMKLKKKKNSQLGKQHDEGGRNESHTDSSSSSSSNSDSDDDGQDKSAFPAAMMTVMNWASDDDEETAEREAAQLEAQMTAMENYYNDLLLDQLGSQEEYFYEKSRQEGIQFIWNEVSIAERAARNHIVAQWRYELRIFLVQNLIVPEMKARTKSLRHATSKMKEELEIHQVMLATASATREKYKKYLTVASVSQNATPASTSNKKNINNNNDDGSGGGAVASVRKPTTLAEVPKCIDEYPEVVALEKELEQLINEMTSL